MRSVPEARAGARRLAERHRRRVWRHHGERLRLTAPRQGAFHLPAIPPKRRIGFRPLASQSKSLKGPTKFADTLRTRSTSDFWIAAPIRQLSDLSYEIGGRSRTRTYDPLIKSQLAQPARRAYSVDWGPMGQLSGQELFPVATRWRLERQSRKLARETYLRYQLIFSILDWLRG
jgi:hypothetical protein